MAKKVEKEMTKEELEREFLAAAKEVADAAIAWKSADERVARATCTLGALGNKLRPQYEQGTWLRFLKANGIAQRSVNRAMKVAKLPLKTVVKWGVVKSEWVVAQFEKGAAIDDARASAYATNYDDFMAKKAAENKRRKAEQAAAKASTNVAARKSGKKTKDAGQKAREAKRKELAGAGTNGAHKTNVVKLGANGEQLAGEGAAVPRLPHQPDKQDQVTETFIEATHEMYECCGWEALIDCVAEELSDAELELAIERLGKLIPPATDAIPQTDVPDAEAVSAQ